MEIQVKNLGTIKEGKIDLSKNLIIFAGQNNTGKSYMAYLSYGLYRNATEIHENIANKTILKIFASKTITPIIKITAKPEPFFLPNSVQFFPAERTAINMLAKEVFREKASKLDEISQQLLAEEDSEAIAKFIILYVQVRICLLTDRFITY